MSQRKIEDMHLPDGGYWHGADLQPFLASPSCRAAAAQRPGDSSHNKSLTPALACQSI